MFLLLSRSSEAAAEDILKIGFLEKFAKFTGKHLCQSLFLIKRLCHRCFPVNYAKFPRTAFFIEHLWKLLPDHFESILSHSIVA